MKKIFPNTPNTKRAEIHSWENMEKSAYPFNMIMLLPNVCPALIPCGRSRLLRLSWRQPQYRSRHMMRVHMKRSAHDFSEHFLLPEFHVCTFGGTPPQDSHAAPPGIEYEDDLPQGVCSRSELGLRLLDFRVFDAFRFFGCVFWYSQNRSLSGASF